MSSYFPNRWPLSYINLTKNIITYKSEAMPVAQMGFLLQTRSLKVNILSEKKLGKKRVFNKKNPKISEIFTILIPIKLLVVYLVQLS